MTESDIVKMTSLERVELVGRFWDSLDPAEYPIPEEHLWILRQCIADYGELDAENEVKQAAERVLGSLERRSMDSSGTTRSAPLKIENQTTDESIRMFEVVLDSVRSACAIYDPTPEQWVELERRIEAHRASGSPGIPVEEVIERIRRRL